MFRRCVTDRVVQRVGSISTTSLAQRRVAPRDVGFCHRRFSNVLFLCLAAATILLLSPPATWAQTSNWVLPAGQSGDWSVASNWDNGVPSSSTAAFIANGGTVTVTQAGEVSGDLYLGPGTVNQTDGSLSWGWLLSDEGGSLAYNISGGTLCGSLAYYTGTITQSGGSVLMSSSGGTSALYIGGGRGGANPSYYTIGGGTLQANAISVGATAGEPGIMNISNSAGGGNTLVTVTGFERCSDWRWHPRYTEHQ